MPPHQQQYFKIPSTNNIPPQPALSYVPPLQQVLTYQQPSRSGAVTNLSKTNELKQGFHKPVNQKMPNLINRPFRVEQQKQMFNNTPAYFLGSNQVGSHSSASTTLLPTNFTSVLANVNRNDQTERNKNIIKGSLIYNFYLSLLQPNLPD